MVTILFPNRANITVTLAFLAIYLLHKFDGAAIFQGLEHLNDFQKIGNDGHFVFQIEVIIFHRQNICRPRLPMGGFYFFKA